MPRNFTFMQSKKHSFKSKVRICCRKKDRLLDIEKAEVTQKQHNDCDDYSDNYQILYNIKR